MKHLFFLVCTFFALVHASAQTPDSFIVLYRAGTLDTARHMAKPERAAAYFQAAQAYAAQEKWDTAAKALDKSNKLWPVDSIVAGDANALVVLARIEQQRLRHNPAIAYAERAAVLAQDKFSTDSLIALSDYMQTLYSAAGNVTQAWRYKHYGDSLRWTAQNNALLDSLASLRERLSGVEQQHNDVTNQRNQALAEKEQLLSYLWLLGVAAALLLIGLIVALLTRKKSPSTNTTADTSTASDSVTQSVLHDLVGLNDLMLQRGRTGDDLIVLKATERELQKLWKQAVSGDFPTAVDEDRAMRSLKGIRLLVFSDNVDTSYLLKNWLRKQIRLCDIQTAESLDGLPENFSPHVVVYDAAAISSDVLNRLSALYSSVPRIISTSDKNAPPDALKKPYGLGLLLDALINVYKPQEETKATDTVVTPVAPVDGATIQFHCEQLEKAYTARNGDGLLEACAALLPLFERANSPALKWLRLLADPPEDISEVQVELAYRNVITYCRTAAK